MKENLRNVKEVASYLKVNVHTVYRMIAEGKIPFTKVGGAYRFRQEDIDNWITKQTKGNAK